VSAIKITDFFMEVDIFGTKYAITTKILVLEGIESIFRDDSYPYTFAYKFASTSGCTNPHLHKYP